MPFDSNISATCCTLDAKMHFFVVVLSLCLLSTDERSKSVNLSVLFDVNRKCHSGKYEAKKPLKRRIDVQFVQTLLNSLEKHKVSGT